MTLSKVVNVLIGCMYVRPWDEGIESGKMIELYSTKTLGWVLFVPYHETTKNMSILNYLSSKVELEARLEQLYRMDFEDDPNHHVLMSVDDRKALDAMSKSIQLVNEDFQIDLP